MTSPEARGVLALIGDRARNAIDRRRDHQVHIFQESPETCDYCLDDVNARWAMLGYY